MGLFGKKKNPSDEDDDVEGEQKESEPLAGDEEAPAPEEEQEHEEEDREEEEDDEEDTPGAYKYKEPPQCCLKIPCFNAWNNCSRAIFKFTYGDRFQNFILGVIVCAGAIVGAGTYPSLDGNEGIKAMDTCILVIFIIEIILKILAEGMNPLRFFFGAKWAWNWFDLIIVVLCLPGVPVGGGVAALRLARLARLFKLVDKIPQLKLILNGLLGGLKAIFYIMLLLFMVFYFYAIIALTVFMDNDPWHFGNFGLALTTLFRMATLEDWTEIMYINFFNCDVYRAAIYAPRMCNASVNVTTVDGVFPETLRPYDAEGGCTNTPSAVCSDPQAKPVATIFFFVSFVVVSSLVLLSMFIGAVTLAMTESLEEIGQSNRKDKKAAKGGNERMAGLRKETNADMIRNMTRDELERHKRMRKMLKAVWDGDDVDSDFDDVNASGHYPSELDSAWKKCYDRIAQMCSKIVEWSLFQTVITITILVASILVGLQTEPSIRKNTEAMDFMAAMDVIITLIFVTEILLKFVGCSIHPLNYFKDNWNVFDLVVVAGSLGNPDLVLLRVVRLLRILKMVKSIPELRMHVTALVQGLSSITYIGIIMFMTFYMMGMVGIIFFGRNDPWHFGNIHLAMITLFRCATGEDWTDVMYINMYGCDEYGYDGTGWNGVPARSECTKPQAFGWWSVLYFVGFMLVGALVMLNLFIGVITAGMEETQKEMDAEKEIEREVLALRKEHSLTAYKLKVFREVFEMIDADDSGTLDREELGMALRAVDKQPTDEELDDMIAMADTDNSGEIEYVEFIRFMVQAENQSFKIMRKESGRAGQRGSDSVSDLAERGKPTQNRRMQL